MLTFVIPVGPYHEAAVDQAVASCLAQTFPCRVIVVYDHDRRGPSFARNRGLECVETDFVCFLDADDTLEPDYAETMLRAYDGRHYGYSDWFETGVVAAPECAWRYQPQGGPDSHHIVTAFVPTVWARWIGGFDETFIHGSEDSEFYIHLTRAGLCGKRVPKPLVHYHPGGQRGRRFVFGERGVFGTGEHFQETMQILTDRYKDKPMPENCGGCGANVNLDTPPSGEQQPGDVLAKTLWMGNRRERGTATGRLYPHTGNGATLWMSPLDIDDAPHLFARVVEMPPALNDDDFELLAGFARQGMIPPARIAELRAVRAKATSPDIQPDVGRILELYKHAE